MASIDESVTATAETPDGRVRATVRGRDEVSVSVDAGWFRGASVADLQWQLTRLAPLLFVERMREYYRERSHRFSEPVLREPSPVTREDHDYVARRAEIQVVGGEDGPVTVTCTGMQHWGVAIDPRWLAGVDVSGFERAVARAASELVAAQFDAVADLKREIWV